MRLYQMRMFLAKLSAQISLPFSDWDLHLFIGDFYLFIFLFQIEVLYKIRVLEISLPFVLYFKFTKHFSLPSWINFIFLLQIKKS